MVVSESERGAFTAFVGTISYRLSHRDFADFVRTGAQSNDLPFFVERLGILQARLEEVDPRKFSLRAKGRSESSELEGQAITLERLTVTSISYEAGSVLAKVQVGAILVASATAFLADYEDAKVGFGHLRDDVVAIAREVFTPGEPPMGSDGQPIQPGRPMPQEEITFYFSRPERFEESIIKSLQKGRE